MKKIFSRLIIAASAGLLALSGCKVFDSLESQDDPVIYSERIDGVTISTDSKEILAGASTTLTAAAESVHAKEDAISYAWSLSAGEEYATLSISGNTATLTANKDAPADSVVTVQCTANYDFGEKNSVSSEKSIDVIGKGNVNATWDLSLCGDEKKFVYYTDSDFTNEVKGAALTNKAAEAVSEGYFKPETTNANGKPYATLKGVNFTRAKLGGNGTALVGYADDLTSKNTSNLKWSHFKEKGSYLTLKLFGDSTVTITGGSVATDEYRGVFVYDAKGNEVASIRGKTTLTNVTFTGTLNDEFYIVGNSGGVSKITCFDENYDPYDAEIESVTVTASSSSITLGESGSFSASIADTLNKDEVSYKWTITENVSYVTLESDTAASCTLKIEDNTAYVGQTITVKCEVTYTHKGKTSKKSATKIITIVAKPSGSVNATWDLSLCGDAKKFVYYTDSDFTNEVKGAALTDKAAEAVSEGYFKPETMNANGKPNATLKGVNFMRVKLGNQNKGTPLIGSNAEKSGTNLSKCTWENFKDKLGYLTLKVYGNCTVTITGGSLNSHDFRGVWVFKTSGEEVASIKGANTALATTTFTASADDEFYIVGNSGGVAEIKAITN